jgi:tartrate dehydratase beta subunit/fumarate hydratase class I family protein
MQGQALHTFEAKDLTVGNKVYEIGEITVQRDGIKVQIK